MSAPISPGGGVMTVRASRSAPSAVNAPRSWASATRADQSVTRPLEPGSCAITPKNSPLRQAVAQVGGDDLDPQRLGPRREHRGGLRKRSQSTASRLTEPRAARCINVIASAAAVASSSIEALATSMPVRSEIMVWKFSNASSRPWLISGW